MKKIALIILATLILTPVLEAQKMNNIKTDLFSPFLRTGVLKYERVLNEDMSLQLGFFYSRYSPRGADEFLSGWAITPEFRYYLAETPAPSGTYLAPNVRWMNLDVYDDIGIKAGTLTSVSFGVNLGKQILFKDVILVDAWVGPTYAWRQTTDGAGDIETGIPDASGFGLRLGIAVGIAF